MCMVSTRIRGGRESSKLLSYLAGLIAVSAWGASFISTKVLLNNGLNAVEIYLYRCLLAYLLIFLFCPRPLFSHTLSDELKLLLCGICGGSVYFISENTSVMYTLVGNVSLITSTSPIITVLLLGALYKNERPSRGILIGSLVAFIGVACVIFNSSFVIKLNPLGDLLALLSAFCWAVYTILLRPLNATYSAWFITRKTFFYGFVTALPFLVFEPSLAPVATLQRPEVWGNLLFLGLFASMAAYMLWSLIVKRLGTVTASNFMYLQPIVTLILSVTILHECVTWIGYLGCSLIIIGLVLSDRLPKLLKRDA